MEAVQQGAAKAKSEQEDNHPIDNAKAWFASIVEMVDALRADTTKDSIPTSYIDADDASIEDEDWRNSLQRDRWAEDIGDEDARRQRILESVLSVEMRSGWYSLTDYKNRRAEFNILLSTGGPALRLIGELDDSGEPETARLEWQDWGTPWTVLGRSDYPATLASELIAEYLLDFARQFYFGEG